ncbi:hypothetical protein M422DRAFT_67876 [Sphaerobolus stellatus SS14]|uniref:F-box domain-containing protein n=1 Tax=Sphaerobolus stellatus (strain SS14) TaxID=990650 RepID=A0A0C9V8S4_SPHS4|nr:hypothetical protein M422DRAFT_67876 [Sphaerobolus stellatus SS14]
MEGLPNELLDKISEVMDSPKDLLALAMTSKMWCNLIIPNHLETRVVRAEGRRRVVWKFFAENPRLAAHIHTVEIVLNGLTSKPILPTGLLAAYRIESNTLPQGLSNKTKKVVHQLRKALANMVNLRSLDVYYESGYRDIFLSLAENPPRSLRELRLFMQHEYFQCHPEHKLCKQFTAFTGLSKVHITIYGTLSYHSAPYLTPLLDMFISGCPDLTDLGFVLYPGYNTPRFLKQGTWPRLKRLTLGSDMLPPLPPSYFGVVADMEGIENRSYTRREKAEIMARFLARHPQLEALKILESCAFLPECLTVDDVPSLKSFCLNSRNVDRVGYDKVAEGCFPLSQLLSPEVASQLEYYEGWITDECLPLLSRMISLKTCVPWLPQFQLLGPFLAAVPHLKRICYTFTRSYDKNNTLWRYGDFISEIPSQLTHWGRFPDISRSSYPLWPGTTTSKFETFEDVLRRLSKLKNLKYFQEPTPGGRDWVEILRDADGNYEGYQPTKDVDLLKHWGGFYESMYWTF